MIRKIPFDQITCSGSDGSATGSATPAAPIVGRVLAVYINYSAGQPATTDVVLSVASPTLTILTVSDNATDGWYYPRVEQQANVGDGTELVGLTTYESIPISGNVTASVTGANADETVDVTLVIEE